RHRGGGIERGRLEPRRRRLVRRREGRGELTGATQPVIREARPDDAAVIAEIWLASFKATYGFPPAHADDEVRAWVRDILLPETETWIAEEDPGVANG